MFLDRKDAGRQLARLLEKYRNQNVLVLGIPRGGVEVAYEVAKFLNGELSIVVAKKLPHPFHPELAIGAVAEDGSLYLSRLGRSLKKSIIDRIIPEQFIEIESRVHRFRKDPLPDMHGRIVIIVDDGIATGSTLIPAIDLCKHEKPSRIIVAAPVSGETYAPELDANADEVVVVVKPDNFMAVGQAYEKFDATTDEEVIALLRSSSHSFSTGAANFL